MPLVAPGPSAPSPVVPTPARTGLAIPATVEQIVMATSLYWLLAGNGAFFSAALHDQPPSTVATALFAGGLGALVLALHTLLLGLVANRWTVKPLLAVLIVSTALSIHFMQRYGVYLDPAMLRNTLRTDPAEATELLSWSLLRDLVLYAGLPLGVLWRVRVVHRPWRRAGLRRLALLGGSLFIIVSSLFVIYQPFSSLMRNHKEVRYLITPANVLWSLSQVAATEARGAAAPRLALGTDAAPGPSWATQTRPRLVVLVVGETARAANWGLNGYARQTTPALAALPVVSFTDVTACGTDTETSLPCMFAPVGRRRYDEARIRGSESLLHVAARAGVAVHWRDNQSGCKGVCEGLPNDTVKRLAVPGLCSDGRCLDEGLLHGLDTRLAQAQGTQLLVLHMLGNHGPSYFRRYPAAYARFQPACESDDLQRCSPTEIVNAYDNALLYTDHVLAELIGRLQASAAEVDSAVVFVSDHGESLGEKHLFLHGMPYPIAPDVQKKVPMLMWLSDGMRTQAGIDMDCMARQAAQPAAHDHLFHTLLGLLDVRTALYERPWDLTHACRRPAAS